MIEVKLLTTLNVKITIPEMDQFAEGLESLGAFSYIKKYPDLMRPLFVAEQQPSLTACKYYAGDKGIPLLLSSCSFI